MVVAGEARTYGITEPISTEIATGPELEKTGQLAEFLVKSNFFESEQDEAKRRAVLATLNQLVSRFVSATNAMLGVPMDMAEDMKGMIFTFGSYRLGVHGKGADIDTLCVVPGSVKREHFFTIFYEMLENRPEVSMLSKVPDAYVPLIKFSFDGVAIDLLFCSITTLSTIPPKMDNLLDVKLLRSLDEKCVLSISGPRTTDEILSLVPDIATFKLSLRGVKFWAKVRCVYGNMVGYMGGIAYAILVARVCQLYPNATASVIIARFFRLYYIWKWPDPVMLKRIEHNQLRLPVWNPRLNPVHRAHKMPIITPAFPSICSTHNVGSSTLAYMTSEFQRGDEIMAQVLTGKKQWVDLFQQTDYFERFKIFIQISVSSNTSESLELLKTYVKSKIRLLISKMEQLPQIKTCPPFPEPLDSGSSFPFLSSFYIGLEIDKDAFEPGQKTLNISGPIAEFKKMIVLWEKYEEDMVVSVGQIKKSTLPPETKVLSDPRAD